MHRGLYLAIMMDRHQGHHTSLNLTLPRGLYLAIIMDRHEGLHTALTIVLRRDLYLLLWAVVKGPIVPLL
jgi:hypothetical protein